MSFILDALRKSEAKRQAQSGQQPGLGQTAILAPATSRPRRTLWIVITSVVLVGLLLVGGWLQRSSTSPLVSPTASSMLSQTDADLQLPTPQGSEEAIRRQSNRPDHQNAPTAPLEQSMQPIAESELTVAVETASAPEVNAFSVVPMDKEAAPGPSQPDVSQIEASIAKATESATAYDQMPVVPAQQEVVAEPVEESTPWQPQAPDYLYQWELPLSVRQALPTLKLTIHVHAKTPEDRFVLINGVRYRQGDELGQGAVLAEIREEGALVDFREYRFLLTR